jgi:hypothetical protein
MPKGRSTLLQVAIARAVVESRLRDFAGRCSCRRLDVTDDLSRAYCEDNIVMARWAMPVRDRDACRYCHDSHASLFLPRRSEARRFNAVAVLDPAMMTVLGTARVGEMLAVRVVARSFGLCSLRSYPLLYHVNWGQRSHSLSTKKEMATATLVGVGDGGRNDSVMLDARG